MCSSSKEGQQTAKFPYKIFKQFCMYSFRWSLLVPEKENYSRQVEKADMQGIMR